MQKQLFSHEGGEDCRAICSHPSDHNYNYYIDEAFYGGFYHCASKIYLMGLACLFVISLIFSDHRNYDVSKCLRAICI